MATRPDILFPLFAELETLPGVGPKTAKLLGAMDVATPRDLFFTLPHTGIARTLVETLQGHPMPDTVTVRVTVGRHLPPAQKGRPYRIEVEDSALRFTLVFFHARADFLQRLLPTGQERIISGKAELYDGMVQITHPDHVVSLQDASEIPGFEPIYPLTQGVAQKTLQKAVAASLTRRPTLGEWTDPALVAREEWPTWSKALDQVHAPGKLADLSPDHPARRRLAYDELFAHQLTLALARLARRRASGRASVGDGHLLDAVIEALPYKKTRAQIRALAEISNDLGAPLRMNRLLQGDVGSGKTLVALLAMLTVVEAGGQAVMMAPTEVLARQHLENIQSIAGPARIRIEILTGRDSGKARLEKTDALAKGEINILLGTHAVFQKDVVFRDLRLAVVDEQHRFGVRERMMLGAKGEAVDVLVMTATPIPRSLALAQYGDMDVSVLDEKPPGRKPVTTALVANGRLDEVIAHLDTAISAGRQAYWVCPLVEESETLTLTAAEDRYAGLRARFGEDRVALVHGQMPHAEKDAAMERFVADKAKILVATTVIEVGVDVPNASIMVVEGAEHFGLAQLHQLRGRVGRGAEASSCLLLYQPPLGKSAERRLSLLRETEDGFRISEVDLEMRGAGDLIGVAQSGLPKFRVADVETQSGLMALAQSDARALLTQDPKLQSPRGQAARLLLWLMGHDESIRLIQVG